MGQGMARQGAGQPCGLGLGLGLGPAVSELKFTDAQTTKLQSIRSKYLADTQTSRTQLQTRLKELAQLWTAEKPSESAIRGKIAQIDTLRAKIRNSMVSRTFSVMSVLTKDQKTKLRSLVKSRPGFGAGMGMGLGLGCDMNGAGCLMGGSGSGMGYRGGQKK